MLCRALGRTLLACSTLACLAAQSPAPTIGAVVNAASYLSEPVSAGEMITIFGTAMGPTTLVYAQLDSQGKLATKLSNVEVLFDGTPSPLIYVSALQIAAMVPFGLDGKTTAPVQVVYNGVPSQAMTLYLAPAGLGVFSADATGKGQAAMTNSDSSYNSPANPAARGSDVTFYLTGAGQTNPPAADGVIAKSAVNLAEPVSIEIAGYPANVLYAGAAPGNVYGFTQVNVVIPSVLPFGGNLPLVVKSNGGLSQAQITVAVAGPHPPTPNATTVFLIHGLLQGDPNSKNGVATSPLPTGAPPLGDLKSAIQQLKLSDLSVDDGFNWGRCANPPALSACPSDCTIEEGAQELAGYLHAAAPSGNIVLVGYSMGGLLARDLLLNNYSNVITDQKIFLLTLGTPNIGYPHLAIDNALICSALGSEMSSDLRSEQSIGGVIESPYLASLNGAWTSSSFPAKPLAWLAVSGTFCPNPLRSLDALGNAGCPDANPFNDGVVCDQSARFKTTGLNLPTATLAAADFAHTKDQLAELIGGSLFESCDWTTAGRPFALFEPPLNSGPLNAILEFLAGIPFVP